MPDALAKRVQALVSDSSVALGATESYPLPGVTTLITVEPRVWTRDEKGALVQGCYRAGGIYLPAGAPEAAGAVTSPEPSKLDRTVGVLTAVSLVVGIGSALAAWGKA